MTEAKIEATACAAARQKGWLTYKFTSPARRSVPDRLFVREGRVVFIEFKSPAGKLTPGQVREIAELGAHGAEVHVCRSVEEALGALSE